LIVTGGMHTIVPQLDVMLVRCSAAGRLPATDVAVAAVAVAAAAVVVVQVVTGGSLSCHQNFTASKDILLQGGVLAFTATGERHHVITAKAKLTIENAATLRYDI